jgi:type VI secretion system FHA domain protein
VPPANIIPDEPFAPEILIPDAAANGVGPNGPLPAGSVIPDDYDPLAGEDPGLALQPKPSRAPSIPRSDPPEVSPPSRPEPPAPPPIPRPAVRASIKQPEPSSSRHTTSPAAAPTSQIPPPHSPPVAIATTPAAPVAPAAAPQNLDFAALLTAAGLDPVAYTPELAANFGHILRVVVTGMMDLLRARERIKDEFRMHMTSFKAEDNNPLKFSANVEDALHNILVKRNAAYLGPVEAFEDAFRDARNHQMAMLAGLRVAFDSMLKQFDPRELQEQFDRQNKKASLLSGPARLRYWDQYRERYENAVQDADAAFRNLFGKAFATAYEEQMQRLKSAARPPGRD